MSNVSHPLDTYRGPLQTRVGAARGGEYALYRGQDIHRDLEDMQWVEMHLFGITGRRWTPAQVHVINCLMTYTSYPDSRIWNNRVAALAGSARSTGCLGVSAALSISEAKIFGGQTYFRALSFLIDARTHLEQGGDLEEFVVKYLSRHRSISGFGRPLTEKDERVAPTLEMLAREGCDQGPLLAIARRVESILHTGRWRYRMNYVAVAAAACGDLGLSPLEFYMVAYPAFLAGMSPCYLEALEKPPGAIMPLMCEEVTYSGPSERTWSLGVAVP